MPLVLRRSSDTPWSRTHSSKGLSYQLRNGESALYTDPDFAVLFVVPYDVSELVERGSSAVLTELLNERYKVPRFHLPSFLSCVRNAGTWLGFSPRTTRRRSCGPRGGFCGGT